MSSEQSKIRHLRYDDLVAAGIIRNRQTLRRWVAEGRFPAPVHLGPNIRAWRFDEVQEHLDRLAAEREASHA